MVKVDFKTVLLAQSNTREQSSKRSGARLKTKSETGKRVFLPRLTRLDIDFEGKKPTILQSMVYVAFSFHYVFPEVKKKQMRCDWKRRRPTRKKNDWLERGVVKEIRQGKKTFTV